MRESGGLVRRIACHSPRTAHCRQRCMLDGMSQQNLHQWNERLDWSLCRSARFSACGVNKATAVHVPMLCTCVSCGCTMACARLYTHPVGGKMHVTVRCGDHASGRTTISLPLQLRRCAVIHAGHPGTQTRQTLSMLFSSSPFASETGFRFACIRGGIVL